MISVNQTGFSSSVAAAHKRHLGLGFSSSQCWTISAASWLTHLLYFDRISPTVYQLRGCIHPRANCVPSHFLMSISLAALVFNQALHISELDTKWYMQREFIFKCISPTCHLSVRLAPFSRVLNSTTLLCCISFSGCTQHISLMTDPFISTDTPTARELTSIHTFISIHMPLILGRVILSYSGDGFCYAF